MKKKSRSPKKKSKSPRRDSSSSRRKSFKSNKTGSEKNRVEKLLDEFSCKDIESNQNLISIPRYSPIFNIKRQINYEKLNTSIIEHREWFWSPNCPLITPTGNIMVSDSQNCRIWLLNLDPLKRTLKLTGEIKTHGRPMKMINLSTGKIAVLVQNKIGSTLLIFEGQGLVESEVKLDDVKLKFLINSSTTKTSEDKSDSPKRPKSKRSRSRSSSGSRKSHKNLAKNSVKIEEVEISVAKAQSICANSDLIFIVFGYIQDLFALQIQNNRKILVQFENYFKDERTDFQFGSSYEIFATEQHFYACSIKARKIMIFWINQIKTGKIVDNVKFIFWQELGLDELSVGYPWGIFVDDYDNILLSDCRMGGIRVYRKSDWAKGPYTSSGGNQMKNFVGEKSIDILKNKRFGKMYVSKNGILCVVDMYNNSLLICYDVDALRRYDDAVTNLSYRRDLRSIFDKMMHHQGLGNVEILQEEKSHYPCNDFIPERETELIPDYIKKRFQIAEKNGEKEPSPKKSSSKNKSEKSKSSSRSKRSRSINKKSKSK